MITKHINIMNMMMIIISRIRLSSGDRPPGKGTVQLFQFKQFCLLWIRYDDVGDGDDDGDDGDDHDHHDEETSRKREVQLIKF